MSIVIWFQIASLYTLVDKTGANLLSDLFGE